MKKHTKTSLHRQMIWSTMERAKLKLERREKKQEVKIFGLFMITCGAITME